MNLAIIIADAGYVVTLAQMAVQTAQDAAPFIATAYDILVNKTALTDAQRATLMAQETGLRALLDAASISADAPPAAS